MQQVLTRIIGKAVVSTLRDDIITSEVYAGQEFGCETAVHAMYKVYKEEHN